MKRILILIIALSPFVSLFAQGQKGTKMAHKREEIESRKIAFISTEIGISPEEAIIFWPIYNAFREKLRAVLLDNRTTLKSISILNSSPTPSKSEMEKLIKKFADNKEKEATLHKDYYNSLSKVLPVEKVAKLIIAEEEFRRQMIHLWKKPHPDSRKERK